jgi:hypothetical protein
MKILTLEDADQILGLCDEREAAAAALAKDKKESNKI